MVHGMSCCWQINVPEYGQSYLRKWQRDLCPVSCRAVQYLKNVQKNVSSLDNVNSGLKPTEIPLPSGCIEEIDANYEGDNVSGIILDGTQLTADDCCMKCKCASDLASQ